mgnify:FL=1|jgi:hypothetical protein
MFIIIWVLQIIVALFCIMGAVWRYKNFEIASKDVASISALSQSTWNAIGLFEMIAAALLILPGLLGILGFLTPLAALALAIELGLLTLHHMRHMGTKLQATNPALWSGIIAILAAIIALARF